MTLHQQAARSLARQELLDALLLLRRAVVHTRAAASALRDDPAVNPLANQIALATATLDGQIAILNVVRGQIPRETETP